jgi:hypothetical protein
MLEKIREHLKAGVTPDEIGEPAGKPMTASASDPQR